ncbi:MAG: NAD(+)/NADH kinase [Clostridia bacterium]|nr:NAD(+)/NADH kinase [Clostridia bacterium]
MKIALLPNLTRDVGGQITKEICGWLNKYGAEYACQEEDFAQFPSIEGLQVYSFEDLMPWCDAIITVGGDGSMLRAAKTTVAYGKPLLCINAGRLAFMAGLESDELHLLKALIDGDYELDPRMLLHVELQRNGRVLKEENIINDVAVCRGSRLKIVDLDVFCDGRLINTYRADGVVVSTPTGSSAYCLAAGGPVLNPSMQGIVVTPICPQSLFARSIVFSSDNALSVSLNPESRCKDVVVSLDGGDALKVMEGDVISITRSEFEAQFIRIKNEPFFEILNHKLAGTEGTLK